MIEMEPQRDVVWLVLCPVIRFLSRYIEEDFLEVLIETTGKG